MTSLRVRVNRDVVSAGDDNQTHEQLFQLHGVGDVADLVQEITARYPRPEIGGGRATWVLSSAAPLAVVAQEWSTPRMLRGAPRALHECDIVDDTLHMYLAYLAQADPTVVCADLDHLCESTGSWFRVRDPVPIAGAWFRIRDPLRR